MKAIRVSVLAVCVMMTGCSVVNFIKPAGAPSYEQIYAVYNAIHVKKSTSADVLSAMGRPEYETLSQSKTIIASAGKGKEGFKTWFNMVTFDENELIAKRKYVFISDEKPKQLFAEPWEGVDFDCKMALPKDVLEQPYANESAKRIAILKEVVKETRKDTQDIGADNKIIATGGMIVGQALDNLVAQLEESPTLAGKLSEQNGFEFELTTYDKGRIIMDSSDDTVKVALRLGSFSKKAKYIINFEKPAKAE